MAFEFDADFDRRLLVGSGIALGGYAVLAAGDPRKICEIYVEPTEICHLPTTRWMGLGFGNAAAHQLAISASKDADPKAVKNGLKVAGVSWLVYAAHNGYLAQNKVHKADVGFASAVGQAVFGALCLWRGFANGY